MEALLPWLSPGLCALLFVASVLFWRDGRGQRKALGALEDDVVDLKARTAAQAQALVNVGRSIAAVQLGDPGDVKLTNAMARPDPPWLARFNALTGHVTSASDALATLTGIVTRHGNEIARLSPIVARTVQRLDAGGEAIWSWASRTRFRSLSARVAGNGTSPRWA